MPNLHDVIELTPPKKSKVETEFKALVSEASGAYKFLASINALDNARELKTKIGNRLQTLRETAFLDTLSLPSSLRSEIRVVNTRDNGLNPNDSSYVRMDNLGRLSSRCQSTLSRLRHTADTLCMVIMPYEALDKRSLKAESYHVVREVEAFVNDATDAKLDLYVVAPLRLYSISQHVAMTSNADGMYSKTHEMTLTTVSLQLPLFRTLFQSLKGLETRVDALGAAQTQMQDQIQSLTQRLVQLEERVEQARKEAYQAKILAEQTAARLAVDEQAAKERSWLALDPLIFAVPADTSLTSESPVIVGPNWGPDFPDVLLDVCGLQVIKGQRKKLASLPYA